MILAAFPSRSPDSVIRSTTWRSPVRRAPRKPMAAAPTCANDSGLSRQSEAVAAIRQAPGKEGLINTIEPAPRLIRAEGLHESGYVLHRICHFECSAGFLSRQSAVAWQQRASEKSLTFGNLSICQNRCALVPAVLEVEDVSHRLRCCKGLHVPRDYID